MLLYWGLFTMGFTIGAVFSFITFAAKKPEEEKDYQESISGLSRLIKEDQGISRGFLSSQSLDKSHKQIVGSAN